ncbi:MAG: hypothetical protein CMJ64_09960 [Planctomycetaceae bacterium]|nr:hypothetical protein [Planctomycetaceae bacterium]
MNQADAAFREISGRHRDRFANRQSIFIEAHDRHGNGDAASGVTTSVAAFRQFGRSTSTLCLLMLGEVVRDGNPRKKILVRIFGQNAFERSTARATLPKARRRAAAEQETR